MSCIVEDQSVKGGVGASQPVPTARDNILRVLRHLGLEASLAITQGGEDRVFAWPAGAGFLEYVVLHEWSRDLPRSVEHYHGARISFREPGGVRPALQAVLHRVDPALVFERDAVSRFPAPYFWELDLDENAPNTPLGVLGHAEEIVEHALTGRKTDQTRIAAMLDERLQRQV